MLALSSLKLSRMGARQDGGSAHIETLGERVRRLRDGLGLTQEEAVQGIPGMSASALSQLENGVSKGTKPDNLIALARRLCVSPEELVTGRVRSISQTGSVNLRETPSAYRSFRDVPIVGNVIASPDGDGFFDDMGFPPGAGEAYIPWPTRDPNAYALRVKGDSMQPRIRPGELLVIEPSARVEPGADVVVRTRDGRKMVKQLLFRRGEDVTLGSVNIAHRQVTISTEEIESMHVVSAIVPTGSARTKENGDDA